MSKGSAAIVGAFAGCSLIWGSTFLAIRIGNTLPAMWAVTLRLSLAAILLTILLYATGNRYPRGKALKAALLYGLFEFGLSFPLLYYGEMTTPSGLAAVLFATVPVIAMLQARAFGLEKLNYGKLGAAVIAIVGVAIVFSGERIRGVPLLGLLAVFAAAFSGSLAGIMLKKGPPQNALGSNAIGSMVGIPICFAISFIIGEKQRLPEVGNELFAVIYLTIAGSIGAFVLFAWLLNHVKATSVSFLGVVVPVIAVFMGWLVLREQLSTYAWIGGLVVIVGVILAILSERRAMATEAPP